MPHEKSKTDNYEHFGGINTKASKYLTGPREVLEAFNVDSSIVGDLSGRPGSTQYFSATFGGTGILGLAEYTKLNGYSKIFTAHPGGMWLGQDNSNTGISLGNMLSNQTLIFNAYSGTTALQSIPGVSFGSQQWDFQTFVDHQFFCDGRAFLKFNGTTQTYWGLPDVVFNRQTGVSDNIGVTGSAGAGVTIGYYYFAFAYMNERGFIGPARVDLIPLNVGTTAQSVYINTTFALTGFGITAMAVYSYYSPTYIPEFVIPDLGVPTSTPIAAGSTVGWNVKRPDERFRLLSLVPTGATRMFSTVGYESAGDIPNVYEPFGQTNVITWGLTLKSFTSERLLNPVATELFKDQLFWFCEDSSSAFFSDKGEPEGWQPEWEFEFRTNDGDKLRGMKTYGNRLVFGKELSLHELTGDDPENFSTREITTDYGILNNRACCTWEGKFWFLDRKGIAEYTGGLPQIVSEKIEDIFKRMNLSAARNTAEMCYMKNRDEVWTVIPIDGSNVNNLLIVYDINGQGWYFWNGPNISKLAKLIGRMGQETSFYGDYSNRVNTFGASYFGDNGSGFTSLVKFRYETPRGRSVENLFRRAFVDAESMAGNATLTIQTKFRADYGTSAQVSSSMVLSKIQAVQDFGIPASSLSLEVSHFSAVDSMRLHGYAMESRWLRNK